MSSNASWNAGRPNDARVHVGRRTLSWNLSNRHRNARLENNDDEVVRGSDMDLLLLLSRPLTTPPKPIIQLGISHDDGLLLMTAKKISHNIMILHILGTTKWSS